MRVYVLLLNAGTDNEGIHSLCIGDRNIVLMFEEEDDAIRYAMLLEAQDFPTPSVEPIDRQEVEDFCGGAGYECYLIPIGFVPQNEFERLLLAPPEQNVDQPDWDSSDGPAGRRLELEPEPEEDPDFSNPALDQIRRRLEGLL
jgi:hypothetical protein